LPRFWKVLALKERKQLKSGYMTLILKDAWDV